MAYFAVVVKGLTPAEVFVLEESDGGVTLPQLVARWTDDGDRASMIHAVPLLAEAIRSLASRGLVEVTGGPVADLDAADLSHRWIEEVPTTDEIIVSITAAGEPWL